MTLASSAEHSVEDDQPDDHGLIRDASAAARAAERERIVARLGLERAAQIDERLRAAERQAFERDVRLDEVEGK